MRQFMFFSANSIKFMASYISANRFKSLAVPQMVVRNCLNGFHSFVTEKPKSYDEIFKCNKVPVNKHGHFLNYYLPYNIKDKFVLEDKPLLFSDDKSIQRLKMKKNVVIDFDLPATPQSILDAGVYYIEEEQNGPLASYCAWMCGNLQLNWFLLSHGIDADCSLFKNNIISFFGKNKNFGYELWSHWTTLEFARDDFSEDLFELELVLNVRLRSAERFANLIYDINQNKLFKYDDFIKWVLESESQYEDMMKLKILHDGEWKEFQEVYSINDVGTVLI